MGASVRKDSFKIWLEEDLGSGDHTTLATIDASIRGRATLFVKSAGVLAGVKAALEFFAFVDPDLKATSYLHYGDRVRPTDRVFELHGSARSLLIGERVALNLMQRMSGIATLTDQYVQALKGTDAILLDTRKTTPGFRWAEKEAVVIGGGSNHRFGLYDRILIKDNHIDHGGGIVSVLNATRSYLKQHQLEIPVEIEVRNLEELQIVLENGLEIVDRVLLDNFTVDEVRMAVERIGGRLETEVSGGIQLENIRAYAGAGVNFISVGALTHQATSLDLSLKTAIGS